MTDGFFDTAKGFLLRPVETFRRSRGESFDSAFVYFVILIVINAVLTALVSLVGIAAAPWVVAPAAPEPATGSVIFILLTFFSTVIGNIILLFAGGLIVHLFVILMGGRQGVAETLKAFIYGDTPVLLLGWIPIVGILAALYTIVLWVIGIRELQQISIARAALSLILPVVIALIIAILLLAALIAVLIGFLEGIVGSIEQFAALL